MIGKKIQTRIAGTNVTGIIISEDQGRVVMQRDDTGTLVVRERWEIIDAPEPNPWYIQVRDDSGHDYVIPEDQSTSWATFLENIDENPTLPDFAIRVEGIRFRQWEEI